MATIDEICNEILDVLHGTKPMDKPIDDMFYAYEYDSDTHWIALGIPPEWCTDRDGEEL